MTRSTAPEGVVIVCPIAPWVTKPLVAPLVASLLPISVEMSCTGDDWAEPILALVVFVEDACRINDYDHLRLTGLSGAMQ